MLYEVITVRQDATADAIKEALQLLQEYAAKGPTAAELQQMQQALPLQDAMAYETRNNFV